MCTACILDMPTAHDNELTELGLVAPAPTHTVDRKWVLAGKAIFTVSNPTGERYTYKIRHKKADDRWPETWFANLLTGPNNMSDYTYMGMVKPDTPVIVHLTKASRYTEDSKPLKVLRWALKKVWAGEALPAGYKIHHEGRCGRCGAPLTVPESIESGYGPECIKKVAH